MRRRVSHGQLMCLTASWIDGLSRYRRLGLTAFRNVLALKPTVYKSLLKLVEFELSQGRYRRHKKQFRSLLRSGMVVIDQLSF